MEKQMLQLNNEFLTLPLRRGSDEKSFETLAIAFFLAKTSLLPPLKISNEVRRVSLDVFGIEIKD